MKIIRDNNKLALRFIGRRTLKAQFQIDPSGFWFGIIWKKNYLPNSRYYFSHIMISIIPFIPLHITTMKYDLKSPSTFFKTSQRN